MLSFERNAAGNIFFGGSIGQPRTSSIYRYYVIGGLGAKSVINLATGLKHLAIKLFSLGDKANLLLAQ